jgi:hypothetical protein
MGMEGAEDEKGRVECWTDVDDNDDADDDDRVDGWDWACWGCGASEEWGKEKATVEGAACGSEEEEVGTKEWKGEEERDREAGEEGGGRPLTRWPAPSTNGAKQSNKPENGEREREEEEEGRAAPAPRKDRPGLNEAAVDKGGRGRGRGREDEGDEWK